MDTLMGSTRHSSSPLLCRLSVARHCMPFCIISHILSLATLAFLRLPHLHQHSLIECKLLEHSALCTSPECPLVGHPHALTAKLYFQPDSGWYRTLKPQRTVQLEQPDTTTIEQSYTMVFVAINLRHIQQNSRRLSAIKTLTQGCKACTVTVCNKGCA